MTDYVIKLLAHEFVVTHVYFRSGDGGKSGIISTRKLVAGTIYVRRLHW
jgi:hypothetical protein